MGTCLIRPVKVSQVFMMKSIIYSLQFVFLSKQHGPALLPLAVKPLSVTHMLSSGEQKQCGELSDVDNLC